MRVGEGNDEQTNKANQSSHNKLTAALIGETRRPDSSSSAVAALICICKIFLAQSLPSQINVFMMCQFLCRCV